MSRHAKRVSPAAFAALNIGTGLVVLIGAALTVTVSPYWSLPAFLVIFALAIAVRNGTEARR